MQSWLGRMDDAQHHVKKLNELYMSTIGAFSTAIEAKDGVTSDHVHRVQAYALGLARALGVNDPSTLQAIEAASLLHDTGKLAVPEHILNKPGRLTPAEFETMKTHVDVGADILSSIDFPYPVVPIVRAHHENWDGTGYPRRLRGEEIPIGARILAVVDCFDALTSDRPYRPGDDRSAGHRHRHRAPREHVRPARRRHVSLRLSRHRAQRGASARAAKRAAPHPWRPSAGAAERRRCGWSSRRQSTDSSEELLAFVSLARVVSQTPDRARHRHDGVGALSTPRARAPAWRS